MSIRIRAVFIIIFTNMVIIFFSFAVGISFVKKNIENSLKTDLMEIYNIANHFIGSEAEVLKLKASSVAQNLAASSDAVWPEIFSEGRNSYPEFIGMAVFNAGGERISSSGEVPAPSEIINDRNIKNTFLGKIAISTTHPTINNGVVFYVGVPLPSRDGSILVVTIPGMHFSQRLSNFVIWKTGHIFIDDSDGYVIANIREQWVQDRINFIRLMETDRQYEEIGSVIKRVISGEKGIGYFSIGGIPRICAYGPVSNSEEGWSIGIVAPLPESPVVNIDKGLMIIALISFILNVIAAIIASVFIKKPFDKIETLKEIAEANSMYKSKFLATMSHEIRSPMNVILGVAESQLISKSITEQTRTSFEKIFDSGHLLLNIINDILDLSKIEAGKFELNPVNYESLSLINDAANMTVMQFGQRQIKFILKVNEDIPLYLFGDELRIKQVLNNLLSNAFKYTNEGYVQLSVDVENTVADKTVLIISVSDTGQGMTKEQVNQLYDEYARFNLEANRTTIGTGLGMAITSNLVKLMDGKITVDSMPGKGTTITVHLPQKINKPDVLGREAAKNLEEFNVTSHSRDKYTKINHKPMPYGKVLVVDDMRANIEVAKLLLEPYKLSIDAAESGFGAIDLIKSGKAYDIVFMDHMMPKMDGIETTKNLRELGYKQPVIALTASAITGQRELFMANGFDGFISKPIDIRQLDDTLNKFIRDKENGRTMHREQDAEKTAPVHLTSPKGRSIQAVSVSEDLQVNIPGIDGEAGQNLYYGDMGIYLAALHSYVPNALDVIDKMQAVSEETLSDYTINVHGLKSISASIGAEKVREDALHLELASKSGNISEVLAKNSALLEDTKILVTHIQTWLDEYDNRNL